MNRPLNSFVIADAKACIGCRVCEVACAVAHANPTVKTAGNLDTPILPRLYLVKTPEVTVPIQCHHCEDAPCAKCCPVAAIKQENNKVMIDEKGCIGCKSCLIACPFGAIELVVSPRKLEESDLPAVVASKCDLCKNRSQGPACVQACPRQALTHVQVEQEKRRRRIRAANKAADFIAWEG